MKSPKSNYVCFCLLVALFCLLICGCQKEMKDPKAALEKQAAQYWTERLVNKNYKYAYEQEVEDDLPPFAVYEERVIAAAKFPASSVETKDAEIDGDRGIVTVVVTCKLPGVKNEYPMPMRDLWLLKEGEWKHYFKGKKK